jgi:hypothetical protein
LDSNPTTGFLWILQPQSGAPLFKNFAEVQSTSLLSAHCRQKAWKFDIPVTTWFCDRSTSRSLIPRNSKAWGGASASASWRL